MVPDEIQCLDFLQGRPATFNAALDESLLIGRRRILPAYCITFSLMLNAATLFPCHWLHQLPILEPRPNSTRKEDS